MEVQVNNIKEKIIKNVLNSFDSTLVSHLILFIEELERHGLVLIPFLDIKTFQVDTVNDENYEEAMKDIEKLMSKNVDPDSYEGIKLDYIVKIVQKYEKEKGWTDFSKEEDK